MLGVMFDNWFSSTANTAIYIANNIFDIISG